MPDSAKARLKASAAAYLQSIHCEPGPFRVIVVCHGEEHIVKAAVWPTEMPGGGIVVGATRVPIPGELPPGSRWLSPLERKILTAADSVEYRSSERIAELIGAKCTDAFKAILTNLADAGTLEPLSGKGYRLAVA